MPGMMLESGIAKSVNFIDITGKGIIYEKESQRISRCIYSYDYGFCRSFLCAEDLPGTNLIDNEEEEKTTILLFVPMERSKPDAKNAARTAFDKTVIMAEEQLNLTVEYRTYTSADYQEKTYDDVSIDRIRHDMDDFYLLNPDVLQKTGEEGDLPTCLILNAPRI